MGVRKRVEITIETYQRTVFHPARRPVEKWCQECARHMSMWPPEKAALVARVAPRSIYRWLEEGRLHFIETQPGELLICVASLPRPEGVAGDDPSANEND